MKLANASLLPKTFCHFSQVQNLSHLKYSSRTHTKCKLRSDARAIFLHFQTCQSDKRQT